jgi:GDSL-like lipase/acylhydrolase family protein
MRHRIFGTFTTLVLVSAFTLVSGPATAATPNAYVALGDSYTAAPFASVPTGDPIDCGRVEHNYPHLVATALTAPVFRDVSCGSAQTKHMTQAQDGLPLGGTNPPQFNALGADTALVTVGIGGNDIGFGGAANRCVQPPKQLGGTSCKAYYTQGGHDEISDKIVAAAPKIAAVLTGIHERAPDATVLMVGYPALLPEDDAGCYPYLPVLPEDIAWLRAKNKELNAMLATQAASNGASYVDWYTPSIGHDMCKPPGIAWTNGAVVVPPSYPAHPNILGEMGASDAVLGVLSASGFAWPASQ